MTEWVLSAPLLLTCGQRQLEISDMGLMSRAGICRTDWWVTGGSALTFRHPAVAVSTDDGCAPFDNGMEFRLGMIHLCFVMHLFGLKDKVTSM